MQVLVTGIGMVNTAYQLAKTLSEKKFDLVLHIGICGCYDPSISIGDVVHLSEEIFAELGATEGDGSFLDLKKMGFKHFSKDGKDFFNSITNPSKPTDFFDRTAPLVRDVKSLTVQTVSGDTGRIARMRTLYDPSVENMEGGAVALVCLQEGVPYFEFRAVSNYVEPRDTSKWNLPLACSTIQKFVIELLTHLK